MRISSEVLVQAKKNCYQDFIFFYLILGKSKQETVLHKMIEKVWLIAAKGILAKIGWQREHGFNHQELMGTYRVVGSN